MAVLIDICVKYNINYFFNLMNSSIKKFQISLDQICFINFEANVDPKKLICSICYCINVDVKECKNSKCKKLFCGNCFEKIECKSKNKLCPFCRTKFDYLFADEKLVSTINNLKFFCDDHPSCTTMFSFKEMEETHQEKMKEAFVKMNICYICKKHPMKWRAMAKCANCQEFFCDFKCGGRCLNCFVSICDNCQGSEKKENFFICGLCSTKCSEGNCENSSNITLCSHCNRTFCAAHTNHQEKEKKEITCELCTSTIDSGRLLSKCRNCNKVTCSKCITKCSICKKIVCISCGMHCEKCDNNFISCRKCNSDIIRKCNYENCTLKLCLNCWNVCNTCEDIFCEEHVSTCVNCEEAICDLHYTSCKLCGSENKLCQKSCTYKCEFCDNKTNALCKPENHKGTFVSRALCGHYVCDSCMKRCGKCNEIVISCSKCIINYYAIRCKYCDFYLCQRCNSICGKCGEAFCTLKHLCACCNKEMPSNNCLSCFAALRKNCIICEKALPKNCSLCEHKFICSLTCYCKYRMNNKEPHNEKNESNYIIVQSQSHVSHNCLCEMFICNDHFFESHGVSLKKIEKMDRAMREEFRAPILEVSTKKTLCGDKLRCAKCIVI